MVVARRLRPWRPLMADPDVRPLRAVTQTQAFTAHVVRHQALEFARWGKLIGLVRHQRELRNVPREQVQAMLSIDERERVMRELRPFPQDVHCFAGHVGDSRKTDAAPAWVETICIYNAS